MSHVVTLKCKHCNEHLANVDFGELFEKFFDFQFKVVDGFAKVEILPKYKSIDEILDFIWNNNIPAAAIEKHQEHELTAE